MEGSAFPVRNRFDSANEEFDLQDSGISLQQYAAIKLRIPMSGDIEIDAMIRESRRFDFAGQAIAGITAKVYKVGAYKGPFMWEEIADEARIMADCLLAELEKKEEKRDKK